MRVLFACERSAGHIFPALSVAKKLKLQTTPQGIKIYFFLTSNFLRGYVQREGFNVFGKYLPFRSLAVEGPFRILEAVYLILRIRPQRVIGFGGRDSFFLILLSSLLAIDTILYEPNVTFGRANRVLSRVARKVLRGFAVEHLSQKDVVVGVPLRENMRKLAKPAARQMLGFNHQPVIFCCGGSQGSKFINQIFVKFITELKQPSQIIHLTGKDKFLSIRESYNKINQKSFVEDFYYNMEILYSAADIIVARSGALTLSEISYYGLAAVLIPHPGGFGHQKENAFYFQKRGAAILYEENNFSYADFSLTLTRLIGDERLRRQLAENAAKINLGVGFADIDITPYC